jgi:glycosyltransferase involved in cell wall biosynthesis
VTEPRIAVLLSTFNGEMYLAEQLDSVLEQDYPHFILVIRDDGSSDNTQQLLEKYRKGAPHQIHCLLDDGRNLGACQSFAKLMQYTLEHKAVLGLEAPYMMFCDQDDIWQQGKIAKSVRALRLLETADNLPALVHSDLRVVDATLNTLAESLSDFQGLQPGRLNFGRLLVANSVTGCTAIVNESLVRRALPIPQAAIMHDWWLAMVAGTFGKTGFLSEVLVNYRQHAGNTLGARPQRAMDTGSKGILARVFDTNSRALLTSLAAQARAFSAMYKADMTRRQRILCRLCAAMDAVPSVVQKMMYRMLRHC